MTEHSTDRTAVYGPVCTVVWEGMGRKAHPYPDRGQAQRRPRFPTPKKPARLKALHPNSCRAPVVG
jgi:hypothetical protein